MVSLKRLIFDALMYDISLVGPLVVEKQRNGFPRSEETANAAVVVAKSWIDTTARAPRDHNRPTGIAHER
jgi:hypothetical protein